MKPVRRMYLENQDAELDPRQQGYFLATGEWEDGHFAYSRLDEHMDIIPEEDSVYYQIRINHQLIMVRG